MPYKISDDGLSVIKSETGEVVKKHKSHAEALAHLRALEANVKDAHSSYFHPSEFVAMEPGGAYRLFPFGKVVKGGRVHDITPEYAARFKLPHFKPAIKLGSHEDTTPSGGSIVALEVRTDGLYAIPEFTPKGLRAIQDGDFRYHSPEALWEDAAIEDPTTGKMIEGPMIVGDALLHYPHLGEAAALYTVEPHKTEGVTMTEEMIQVKKEDWDFFQTVKNLFAPKPPKVEEPPAQPAIDPDKFSALQQENADIKQKLDAMNAKEAHAAEVMSISTDLKAERFGAMFAVEAFRAEAAEHFSALPKAEREWFMQKFAALAGQVDFAQKMIGKEFGVTGEGTNDPVEVFTALIVEKQKEKGFEGAQHYGAAVQAVANANPEAAAAYREAMQRRATKKE